MGITEDVVPKEEVLTTTTRAKEVIILVEGELVSFEKIDITTITLTITIMTIIGVKVKHVTNIIVFTIKKINSEKVMVER